MPDKPRTYTSKVKNAQEAHEAVRPAGENFRTPAQTGLNGDEFRLYELIWMRTVASQMKDAEGRSVTVRLGGPAASGEDVVFSASGRVITFHGFLKAYVEGSDDPDSDTDDRETRLPNVSEGDPVSAASISATGHQTKPPARYTEASLIRELEERQIGRPSTYASIIGTILNRGYVYKKGTALVPAWLAFSVIRLLEEHFTRLVSYEFTASMEDVLDEIAGGRRDRNAELARRSTSATATSRGSSSWSPSSATSTPASSRRSRSPTASSCGSAATAPTSRPGGGRRRRPGAGQRARGPAARRAHAGEGPGAAGEPGRRGDPPRRGPRVRPGDRGEERPLRPLRHRAAARRRAKSRKPRTGSLFKSMNLDTISLEDALKLLTLPRVVGVDPESGDEITAQNGRYGPYLKKGTDSRSIDSEEKLLTISLEEAQAIYAQPKQRGRAAADPGKEVGTDPVSGQVVGSRAGGSAPTSPTASSTRRCARATTRRR